jgi:hypothetical protein
MAVWRDVSRKTPSFQRDGLDNRNIGQSVTFEDGRRFGGSIMRTRKTRLEVEKKS